MVEIVALGLIIFFTVDALLVIVKELRNRVQALEDKYNE